MDIGRINPKFTPTSRHGPLGRAEQFQDSVTLFRGQKVKKGTLCPSSCYTRGHQVRSWRAGVPAEFSSNPNQTHLKQLIKVLLGILETSMQVCWGKLELNSAGHRPSRIKFDDPCATRLVGEWDVSRSETAGRRTSKLCSVHRRRPLNWPPKYEAPSCFLNLLSTDECGAEIGPVSESLPLTWMAGREMDQK